MEYLPFIIIFGLGLLVVIAVQIVFYIHNKYHLGKDFCRDVYLKYPILAKEMLKEDSIYWIVSKDDSYNLNLKYNLTIYGPMLYVEKIKHSDGKPRYRFRNINLNNYYFKEEFACFSIKKNAKEYLKELWTARYEEICKLADINDFENKKLIARLKNATKTGKGQ